MRFLFVGMLLSSLAAAGALQAGLPRLWSQLYPDLHSKSFGRLTMFWAQEAVGAPEGHCYIAQLEAAGFVFHESGIGIFEEEVTLDAAFLQARIAPQLIAALKESVADYGKMLREAAADWHTDDYVKIAEAWRKRQLGVGARHVTAVANLLSGEPPVGISRKGVIAAEVERTYYESDGNTYMKLVGNSTHRLDIVNLSSYFTDFQTVQALAAYGSAPGNGILYVMCAGNDFPTPLYGHGDDGTVPLPLITVGSCAPTGYFSSFSRAGEYLTISAPSDEDIQSIAAGTGGFTAFGGSSGAAPLVSGALADVVSMLPQLTHAQAIYMLQMTAIPTAINARGEGHGVLNYYKLLRVAESIHTAAAGDVEKVAELIFTPSLYDFSAEAAQQRAAAQQADPDTAFVKLREAFFLDPHDRMTRTQLAAIYREAGYEAQALFYDNPDVAMAEHRVTRVANYRQALKAMAKTEIFAAAGGFSTRFKHCLDLALDNPQRPELLETLLSRLSRAALQDAQLSGDLMQALQLDPAVLVLEKPRLFAVLQRQQQRLLQ